jgi:hypothetical protein
MPIVTSPCSPRPAACMGSSLGRSFELMLHDGYFMHNAPACKSMRLSAKRCTAAGTLRPCMNTYSLMPIYANPCDPCKPCRERQQQLKELSAGIKRLDAECTYIIIILPCVLVPLRCKQQAAQAAWPYGVRPSIYEMIVFCCMLHALGAAVGQPC